MKPLKEIGHECFVGTFANGRHKIVGNVSSALMAKLEGCNIGPGRCFSLEERRELVRAVWEASAMRVSYENRVLSMGDVEEFIEENEL